MMKGRARVLVVAESDALSATIEAALRDDADVDVIVGRTRTLAPPVEERDPAAVVLAVTAARADSMLSMLGRVFRASPVVLLVEDPRAAWTAGARRHGVRAILGRDAPAVQIVTAVRAVLVGLVTLDPDVFRAADRATLADADDDRALTGREREILEMMAEGLSNRAIAERLRISRYTVKFHVASILGKLGAGSRTEAVTVGVRTGLISL